MTRKTLTTLAAAGAVALGGLAIGAGPASAFPCPAGQHVISMGSVTDCMPNASGGGTGGNIVYNGGGKPHAPSGTSTGPVYDAPPAFNPPKNYAPPKSAPPAPAPFTKVGAVLKADQSGWAKGTTLKYRWTRNGATISGATAATYKVRPADKGKKVAVSVTGKKSGHSSTKSGKQYLVR
ncbi:hypothetical protein [Arthrobacter sp. ok362]|uniref:hypothetical protein n=1 Tax=Arthrobacter sp. ok362 TaxID=1761745 RepID=UPI0008899825|nr:hypothetical protein [Arthrobacter sp. ok362]SDL53285.1 hypothetical protein SAMN04487913_110164 [Arthrobacter sp. ok362]